MNFLKKLFGTQKNEKITEQNNVQNSSNDIQNKNKIHDLKQTDVTIRKEVEKVELSAEEIDELIDCIVDDFFTNHYDLTSKDFDPTDKDALFDDAARLIVASQSGSISLIQRRMKLGINRASRIMDQLESASIVGPDKGSKPRDILINSESSLEAFLAGEFDSIKSDSTYILKKDFFEVHAEEIERRISIRKKENEDNKIKFQKEKLKKEILLREQKRQIQKDAIKELIDEGLLYTQNNGEREIIPQDVMDDVWRRDGGKCVKCGSQENLEFDHIIPFSKGGATTYRNMQILCKKCNIEKSNKIG